MGTSADNKIVMLKTGHKLDQLQEIKVSPVVKQAKESLIESVITAMSTFFDRADDLLFELSEKAGSGSEQSCYFDAMRGLRVRRKNILSQYRSQLDESVLVCLDSGGRKVKKEQETELGLIDNDQMEKTVALENMASRVIECCGDDWVVFRARWNSILPVGEYSDQDCPLGPFQLGDRFFDVIDFEDWEIRVKLILFKLFEQQVAGQFSGFYQKTSAALADLGIKPDLSAAELRAKSAVPAPSASVLKNLLASGRGENTGSAPVPAGAYDTAATGAAVPGAFNPAQQMLFSGLTQMQQLFSLAPPTSVPLPELREMVQNQALEAREKASNQDESDIISLVAMLFDFILEERELQPQMKQLMARMQIPIIKVALLDKTFFDDHHHVARRLLNVMSRSAVGWHPEADIGADPLLDYMEGIVQHLAKEFKDDISVFTEQLKRFEEYLEQRARNQNICDARLTTAEEQSYEEEVQRDWGREFLDDLLDTAYVPEDVRPLLSRHWYRVLNLTQKKFGDGDQWQSAKKIATELVWSLQPGITRYARDRFFKVIPKIMLALRKGLISIRMQDDEINQWTSAVDQLHLREISIHEQLEKAQAEVLKSTQSQLAEIQQQPATTREHEPAEPGAEDYLGFTRNLEQGAWYELQQMNGEWLRCRLLTVLGDAERFIFTDHTGEKVADRSLYGLANAVKSGRFRRVEALESVEKALAEVTDSLSAQSAS